MTGSFDRLLDRRLGVCVTEFLRDVIYNIVSRHPILRLHIKSDRNIISNFNFVGLSFPPLFLSYNILVQRGGMNRPHRGLRSHLLAMNKNENFRYISLCR